MRPLLAIESSCDETAAAVLDIDSGEILSNIVHTQAEHAEFGGVVPEIASREHLAKIHNVVQRSLDDATLKATDLNAVAATYGPGLIGALLVGVQMAKGIAQARNIPFVGVHHIEGHLMAASISDHVPESPFIGLVASGGHSALYRFAGPGEATLLGETRDDAAGEAYDKTAKLLGLGYPGGVVIDRLAEQGDATRFKLPISLKDRSTYDYSFSGLKTAVRVLVQKLEAAGDIVEGQRLYDVCACLRKAITDALLAKAMLACRRQQVPRLVLGGGVSANSLLRSEALRLGKENDVEVFLPERAYCTDNAVMIAAAARAHFLAGRTSPLSLHANAGAKVEDSLEAFQVRT
ncbi:MAG: tRNA (adenosine(37)-N6)-threonylcarbamoyltransferase complex transferase subunit TsaD [Deltaproteobacteria bacterium]|nr:tRNA (adenosine(37)-N6)-threonylcarbamoyltransferase complex transferase subunit TsaD [Deltaproteobacteria bacterium]